MQGQASRRPLAPVLYGSVSRPGLHRHSFLTYAIADLTDLPTANDVGPAFRYEVTREEVTLTFFADERLLEFRFTDFAD